VVVDRDFLVSGRERGSLEISGATQYFDSVGISIR